MKTKKIIKNLSLRKETISNLESIIGGNVRTEGCHTFDLSNCETWEFPICEPCTLTTELALTRCIVCP